MVQPRKDAPPRAPAPLPRKPAADRERRAADQGLDTDPDSPPSPNSAPPEYDTWHTGP